MPRHLVHVHFTCQSFKEAHKILLRGFGPQRGWVGTHLVRNLVFLEQVKKHIMFCPFWRFFSVVIFVDAPKKREGSSIHLCIYDIF